MIACLCDCSIKCIRNYARGLRLVSAWLLISCNPLFCANRSRGFGEMYAGAILFSCTCTCLTACCNLSCFIFHIMTLHPLLKHHGYCKLVYEPYRLMPISEGCSSSSVLSLAYSHLMDALNKSVWVVECDILGELTFNYVLYVQEWFGGGNRDIAFTFTVSLCTCSCKLCAGSGLKSVIF